MKKRYHKYKVLNLFMTMSFMAYAIIVFGQTPSPTKNKLNKTTPADFGFKHIKIPFQKDSIDVLLLSKKGDELKSKPLFFFCQGSMPIPLLIMDGAVNYPSFPFDTKALSEKYHLAIVGKPGIPLIADVKELQSDFSFLDSISNQPPVKYIRNNLLEYYVKRNITVLQYFIKQKNIDKKKVIVAGHSQGARIAFEMALKSKRITHLIYASGNPCGQIMSMISQSRQRENPFDTTNLTENNFKDFEAIVLDPNNTSKATGDSFKSIYSFSKSSLSSFPKLKIPVYICYGTLDPITPFNDLLRTEIIRSQKNNFTFKTYVGLDHNYFGIKETGETDFEKFNWDHVANEWLNWLNTK